MTGRAKPDALRAAAFSWPLSHLASSALALGLLLGTAVGFSMAAPALAEAQAGPHAPLTLSDGRPRIATTAGGSGEIADVNAYCGSCHRDAATDAETGAEGHPEGSAARDHPVNVVYPLAKAGYRSRDALAPALPLFEDRVTCLTCHAHADPDHAIVLPGRNSELCRACHLK